MRAVIAVAIAGLGAGCPSGRTCLIEDVITDRVGAQELFDCGTADPTTPIADVEAIRDCVLANQTAQLPFRALQRIQGIDSDVARAYLGVTEGGAWRVYQLAFDGDPTGGGGSDRPSTFTHACASLDETAACDDFELRRGLCLACAGSTVADECRAE